MSNRTVLITGSSSGIGAASAVYFAANGWNVVATMRNAQCPENFRQYPNLFVTTLDHQDHSSITAAIEGGLSRFGQIDVVVNNAGFGLYGVFESTPREKVIEQFEVNLFGLMDVTRALLPHFRERGSGTIINIGSGAGVHTLPLFSLYCASKFAVEGFSEALSYELADQNIRVKIVEPGGISNTKFADRRRTESAATPIPAPYKPYVDHCAKIYAQFRDAPLATVDEVVQVIVTAATDATPRLRYVVSEELQPLLKARRELSESRYWDLMCRTFR